MPQHLTLVRQYADIETGHEPDDRLVPVRPSDSDVVQPPLVAQGDRPSSVDAVPSHPCALGYVEERFGRSCLVACLEGSLRGEAVFRPVRTHLVVAGDESADLLLELRDRGGRVLLCQVCLECLVEPLDCGLWHQRRKSFVSIVSIIALGWYITDRRWAQWHKH